MIVTVGDRRARGRLGSAANAERAPRRPRGLVLGMVLLALAGSARASGSPAPASADAVDRGRAIVQRDCAGCHAVGTAGNSPNPNAPQFRRLHERYDVDALGEALAEGLTVGHGPMPEWSFGPSDTAAILAYLKTLEAPGKGKAKRQPAT